MICGNAKTILLLNEALRKGQFAKVKENNSANYYKM